MKFHEELRFFSFTFLQIAIHQHRLWGIYFLQVLGPFNDSQKGRGGCNNV